MRKLMLCFSVVLCFVLSTSYAHNAPFVMASLYGQFGNQLFQISTAISLALDNNVEAIFPELTTSLEYGIPENYSKVFYFLNADQRQPEIKENYYFDKPSTYVPIPYKPCLKIHGHFQSWKYFDHHREFIQKLFSPTASIKKYLEEKYGEIISDPKTVSIHIRRYAKDNPALLKTYPFHGVEYVKEAMGYFPEDSHFIIFSNDIHWCKKNLSTLSPHIQFIEGEHYLHDFYLQSMCKHHIISNSTYSWWAAYLNRNPDKFVVAPQQWYHPDVHIDTSDLLPPSWIVVNPQ